MKGRKSPARGIAAVRSNLSRADMEIALASMMATLVGLKHELRALRRVQLISLRDFRRILREKEILMAKLEAKERTLTTERALSAGLLHERAARARAPLLEPSSR